MITSLHVFFFFFFFFASSSVFSTVPEESSSPVECFNAGTPLNATDCQCPGFVSGRRCEQVNCQRFSIPDKNRCVCPPGWYDKYCGIRGCRPPNEDNLDLQKRSFVVVFNMKTSMAEQLKTLRDNFKETVSSVTKAWNSEEQTDDWIENFIIYGFVQSNQQTNISKTITQSADDVVAFLDEIQLQEGDETQPVLTALKNSQQTFPQMKSHAVVLVFTDSPASEATPWSHRFTDKNAEQSCLQISLLWRSKVSFLLSLPLGSDLSSDGVDVYRRLSLTNHGDTFYMRDASDLKKILLSIVGAQYFSENVAVGYGIRDNEDVTVTVDEPSDQIFFLLTVDPSLPLSLPTIERATVLAEGSTFRFYTTTSQSDGTFRIAAPFGVTYNYRCFVQSKRTVMFDYNDDMNIDVGNGMAVIGIPMSATMQTFGFPQWLNSSYEVRSATGSLLREKFFSYLRPQLDCTFLFGFPVWDTLACPPGPITQVHTFYYNGFTQQRVTSGYCIESDHNAEHPNGVVSKTEITGIQSVQKGICEEKNVKAIRDPRLEEHKQFVFILEQHSGNRKVFETLANEMRQIVKIVNSTTVGTYRHEFSLIVHDDKESRVLLSSYSPDTFSEKFGVFVRNLTLLDNLDDTMGLLSIVQAQKLNIQPTAQVYYFTNQAVKSVKNVSRTWDIVGRDIEVNFLTVADGVTTEIFALPSQLELIQKMSNGRLIPLGTTETTLLNLFSDMMRTTAMTTDKEQYDCHTTPLTANGFVERDAETAVIQIVGSGLRDVTVSDATGIEIPLTNYTSYRNPNFVSFNIDLNSYSRGIWRISASASAGGCQITVRQRTAVGLILGFMSSQTDDDVSTQIISQRSSQSLPIFVPIRVNSEDVVPNGLEILIVNRQRYDLPLSYFNSSVSSRASSSCSYGFISENLIVPRNELTVWIVSGYESDVLVLHRIFYYYQHFPRDISVCHGGQVDQFGRCVCPERYTGDYCWDRVCQPAATYSFGICSCPPGFYGDFCEIELVLPANATTEGPSGVGASSTTLQTTTSPSNSRLSILMLIFTIFTRFLFV